MSEPTAESQAPDAAAEARPSPGALLKQARERAGLGVEDLAGQLKLAKGTLEALEADDFAALSEPVYIRGYYRKIAKLLPVPEGELIAAYDARSRSAKPGPAKSVPAMQRIPLAGGVAAGSSRQTRGQGVGIVVAVLVVVALLVVFADRDPPKRLAERPGVPAAPAESPVAASSPTPALAPAPSLSEPPAPSPGVAPVPPAAIAPAPPAVAAAPPGGPEQLVLDLKESSFVRVEDSRGKTLAIGLVRGGERQALDGRPPYTVFLGNAKNVKVFYGGQPIDFAAHVNAQNDTARFTVP